MADVMILRKKKSWSKVTKKEYQARISQVSGDCLQDLLQIEIQQAEIQEASTKMATIKTILTILTILNKVYLEICSQLRTRIAVETLRTESHGTTAISASSTRTI